jgi:hypothetical protein
MIFHIFGTSTDSKRYIGENLKYKAVGIRKSTK